MAVEEEGVEAVGAVVVEDEEEAGVEVAVEEEMAVEEEETAVAEEAEVTEEVEARAAEVAAVEGAEEEIPIIKVLVLVILATSCSSDVSKDKRFSCRRLFRLMRHRECNLIDLTVLVLDL